MQEPGLPENEADRIATLHSLNILDTPRHDRFDRYTRMCARIFDVPISVISLVDRYRQWFKSAEGLEADETPRKISFCGHAILDDKIMVVKDADKDQRFCDNPLVCGDPNIRFYAGYPLAAPDGSRIGTLCVIDNKPKDVSPEQLQLLRELGRMVEEELIAANDTTIDVVTGLSNRNGFLAIANHLLPMCRRKDQPATLLMFHAQNLLATEEQVGRTAADTMATELAHILMASFRDSDIVARLTFDTFCVLLAGTDLDGVDPARFRFDAQLSERNRDPDCRHEILIDTHAVSYKEGRHDDAAALLQDAEVRILEPDSEAVA